jgi:hypothetical protein
MNWLNIILSECDHLQSRLNNTSTTSNILKQKVVNLYNRIKKIDWISNSLNQTHCQTESGLKSRLSTIRKNVLKTKRIIRHNKRVFQCRKNQLELRSNFESNPRKEIQKLFSTTEDIPCPINVDDLEEFWSTESKSGGTIDASFFPDIYNDSSIEENDLKNSARSLSLNELEYHLKQLKTKKAVGSDRVPNEFWKLQYEHIRLWLITVFQKCMDFGNIPQTWKFGITVLLYKGGAQNENRNWRPITLLSTIYKLFASIIASRLSIFTKSIKKDFKRSTGAKRISCQ